MRASSRIIISSCPWAPAEKCLTPEEKIAPVADDWVQRMIDTPGRPGHLRSGDHVTHYLEWGDASNARVLLLLHGFRGHAHWWDFVAPWFAHEYRVIAIDFGGNDAILVCEPRRNKVPPVCMAAKTVQQQQNSRVRRIAPFQVMRHMIAAS